MSFLLPIVLFLALAAGLARWLGPKLRPPPQDLVYLPGLYRSGNLVLGSFNGWSVKIQLDSKTEPWLTVIGAGPRLWITNRGAEPGKVLTGDGMLDTALAIDGDPLQVSALMTARVRAKLLALHSLQLEVGEGGLRLWQSGSAPEAALRAAVETISLLQPGRWVERAEAVVLDDPHPMVRRTALRRLVQAGKASAELLEQLMTSGQPLLRAQAAILCDRTSTWKDILETGELGESSSGALVLALAGLPTEEFIPAASPALLQLLPDLRRAERAAVRAAALRATVALQPDSALEVLLHHNPDALAVVELLGELGDPRGEQRLIDALYETDTFHSAARALARIGTQHCLEPLQSVLQRLPPPPPSRNRSESTPDRQRRERIENDQDAARWAIQQVRSRLQQKAGEMAVVESGQLSDSRQGELEEP